MKEFYEKSLSEIQNIGILLTRSQWNQIAKNKNLLSAESLKYISGIEFDELCLTVIQIILFYLKTTFIKCSRFMAYMP